ncbi:MAG: ABC transporter ATP-binding protein, partial [Devosia sp.]|nr:ABC transporter ATP-binding protein [Devosia sp.]
MTEATLNTEDDSEDRNRRPPRAVVGSSLEREEEVFGKAYDPKIVRRIWAFVKPYRSQIYLSVAAVLVFTLTSLAFPLVIRYAIDNGMAQGGGGRAVLLWCIVGFAGLILINFIASWIQETVVGKAAENVLFDMRRAMFAHLQRVSLSWMDKTEVGRLMSRLMGDVNSMQEFLETSVLSVGDIVLLFGIVGVLLWLDPMLGLITMATMPILFIVRLFWLPPAKVSFMAAHHTNSSANGALAEGINGVRTVQSLDRQQVNFDLYEEKARANLRAHLRAAKFAQVMVPIVDTLTGISMATVIVVGGQMVLGRELDVGVMVAFLFYIQRFFDPIRSLTMQYSVFQRAMSSGTRITEVLDVPVNIEDKPDAVALTGQMDGSVEFNNVTFGYRKDLPVLKNVSFRVNPGETV